MWSLILYVVMNYELSDLSKLHNKQNNSAYLWRIFYSTWSILRNILSNWVCYLMYEKQCDTNFVPVAGVKKTYPSNSDCRWRWFSSISPLTLSSQMQVVDDRSCFENFLEIYRTQIVIAIFGFSMKNAFKWVQTSLVLVLLFLR